MLTNGFDINSKNKKGKSALHVTAKKRYMTDMMESLRFLVANHCDINDSSDEGLLAIDYAIKAQREDVVKLLIDSGCDLNLTDAEGKTPLHRAVVQTKLYDSVKMAILEHER